MPGTHMGFFARRRAKKVREEARSLIDGLISHGEYFKYSPLVDKARQSLREMDKYAGEDLDDEAMDHIELDIFPKLADRKKLDESSYEVGMYMLKWLDEAISGHDRGVDRAVRTLEIEATRVNNEIAYYDSKIENLTNVYEIARIAGKTSTQQKVIYQIQELSDARAEDINYSLQICKLLNNNEMALNIMKRVETLHIISRPLATQNLSEAMDVMTFKDAVMQDKLQDCDDLKATMQEHGEADKAIDLMDDERIEKIANKTNSASETPKVQLTPEQQKILDDFERGSFTRQ